MQQGKRANILVIFILIGAVIAFAFSYNSIVTKVVADAAYNDREILHNYNNEIIEKLTKEKDTTTWTDVVEQYGDIVIVIENSGNKVVTKSIGRTWTALDVKVQTPFKYQGEAYVIKSSVYLLRDYVSDISVMVKFFFMEFLIGLSVLFIIVFIICSIVIKPYKRIYNAIEEYDNTGTLPELKIKGYAGKVYARLVFTTKKLEKGQQNQRRIIASISHDIKTPLTSILGYTERLKKSNISAERRERYLDTVYGKSLEIGQLIDEFDEYLSYNMQKGVNAEKISSELLTNFLLDNYSEELEIEKVLFSVQNKAQGASVMLDLQKFKRVFGNIFSNSLKHFNIVGKEITVLFSCDKEKFYIEITDNGEGVDEDKLEIIFEPLYTSDEGRKVAGLGLAVCKEIVDSHEGKIFATINENGGLSVHIELQRAK